MVSPRALPRPTLVSVELYILFFDFNIEKPIRIMLSKMYLYYKRNTSGFWLHPGPMLSKKVFRLARDILKRRIIHKLILHIRDFYYIHIDTIYFKMGFRLLITPTGRLCIYLVHSLSMWFTHSFIFPLFRLRIDPALT